MRDTVIYVGSMMLPDKNAAAQRALSISKSFRNLGYRVAIVGRSADATNVNGVLSTKGECQGFETFSIPEPKSTKQWIYHTVSAKEFIEVIEYYGVERIKCVLIMEYEAVPLLKLSRYCKKHGIAMIADNLEWFGKSQRSFPMNVAKDIDTWLRMRIIYPIFTKNMICISKYLFNHYRTRVDNCVFIPGTIDSGESKWSNLEYRPNDVFTLGYAGNPGAQFEKERLDYLVEAVAELNKCGKTCRLLLAGIDDDFVKQHENIEKAVRSNPDMIICKGKLSHRESLEMIAGCDFSVIARESKRVTNAGFPTKLSESFGCGTPVLSTRTSNIADYIPNEYWGIVCDGYDVDAIKRMIESAMNYETEELEKAHCLVKHENPLRYERFDRILEDFIVTIK